MHCLCVYTACGQHVYWSSLSYHGNTLSGHSVPLSTDRLLMTRPVEDLFIHHSLSSMYMFGHVCAQLLKLNHSHSLSLCTFMTYYVCLMSAGVYTPIELPHVLLGIPCIYVYESHSYIVDQLFWQPKPSCSSMVLLKQGHLPLAVASVPIHACACACMYMYMCKLELSIDQNMEVMSSLYKLLVVSPLCGGMCVCAWLQKLFGAGFLCCASIETIGYPLLSELQRLPFALMWMTNWLSVCVTELHHHLHVCTWCSVVCACVCAFTMCCGETW